MRIAKGWAPAIGVGLMVLVVAGAMASGYWTTQGRFVTGGGSAGGNRIEIAPDCLAPADLRGWMTIQEACTGLGLREADLLAALGLAAGTSLSTTLKDLNAMGIPMADLRRAAEELLARPR